MSETGRRWDWVAKGDAHYAAKLRAAVVPEVRASYARGETYAEIAERFGVTKGIVRDVIRGRAWNHVK